VVDLALSGLSLTSMILQVFSNPNNSMILFAFRYLFQPSDSLCIGNGKTHFHLGASYTFTSGGGMCTGSSYGSVNVLEISPPPFLMVTCSRSHTSKLHLSASCLI